MSRAGALLGSMLLVAGLGLSGCATPAVNLQSATLSGAAVDGARFNAILAIDNPNAFDIQVRAVRANVRIEGSNAVIPIMYQPDVWIPAGRVVQVALPITVPWSLIPRVLASTATGTEVPFTVIGNADITATRAFQIDRDQYAFNEEGTLPRSFFLQVGGTSVLSIGLGQR